MRASHRRRRQQHPLAHARSIRNACCASHSGRAGERRREHRRLAGRQPPPQLVEVRLDATELGREVVGDQQRGTASTPRRRAPERATRRRRAAARARRARTTAPVANAPRSPVTATTAPQMNAPSPCDTSKNDENVPTTDARSASLDAVEREQRAARDTSATCPPRTRPCRRPGPATVGHAAIDADADRDERQRERRRVRGRRADRARARRRCARRG